MTHVKAVNEFRLFMRHADLDDHTFFLVEGVLRQVHDSAYVRPELTALAKEMEIPELTSLLAELNRTSSPDLVAAITHILQHRKEWGCDRITTTLDSTQRGSRPPADIGISPLSWHVTLGPAKGPGSEFAEELSGGLVSPDSVVESLSALKQWIAITEAEIEPTQYGFAKSIRFWAGGDPPKLHSAEELVEIAKARYLLRKARDVVNTLEGENATRNG